MREFCERFDPRLLPNPPDIEDDLSWPPRIFPRAPVFEEVVIDAIEEVIPPNPLREEEVPKPPSELAPNPGRVPVDDADPTPKEDENGSGYS